jgi:hypothetical protein
MTKPLGYDVDIKKTVEGDSLEQYGSMLQGLDDEEKLYLICELAQDLALQSPCTQTQEVCKIMISIGREISEYCDEIALLKSLVSSL